MLKRLQQSFLESDHKVLRFVGKFLQRDKQFLWGIVAGIVVTIIAIGAWDFLIGSAKWDDQTSIDFIKKLL